MDRDTRTALTIGYIAGGVMIGFITLLSTNTNGRGYEKVANKDPTGIVDSDLGRGIFQVGRSLVTGICWPVALLSVIGKESRDKY